MDHNDMVKREHPVIDLTADEDIAEPIVQRRRLQEDPEPDDLLCPITRVMFRDPVMLTSSGITFERDAIEKWLSNGNRTCPVTKKTIALNGTCTNFIARRWVDRWLSENPDRMPEGWETREMLSPAQQPQPEAKSDLDVLREWRESCPELRNLWQDDDPGNWEGVTWSDGRVTMLHISGKGLSGPLPRLEGLTRLVSVRLHNNQLSGPIPEKLFKGMTSLVEVHLYDNQLSGPIPEKLCEGLTSLWEVYLDNNQLSGSIPEKPFEGTTSLVIVSLNNNQLSGAIPEKLFEGLTSLRYVDLRNNQLSGPIPEKLFQGLTSLDRVYLDHNQLSGAIPEKLFEGQTSLEEVDLNNNRLSGPIPESLRAAVVRL